MGPIGLLLPASYLGVPLPCDIPARALEPGTRLWEGRSGSSRPLVVPYSCRSPPVSLSSSLPLCLAHLWVNVQDSYLPSILPTPT